MRALLEEAVQEVISSEACVPQLLGRFNGVYLQDGTVLSLPDSLAEPWPGSGGVGEQAAMRVQARVELLSGSLSGLWLQEAREASRSGPAISTPLPRGSLFDADMGYFTLQDMRQRGKLGQYWTAHSSANLTILDKRGQWWDLLSFLRAQEGDEVDVEVVVGKRERLAVRLIAVRVSKEEAQRRRERENRADHSSAQRLPSPSARQAQAQRAAAWQAQAQKSQSGPLAFSRLDHCGDQCSAESALGPGSLGAGTLELPNRTAVEAVERAWQARHLAQLQARAHPDRDLRQALRLGDHPLAESAWLLASPQPQLGQSQTGRSRGRLLA
jgi:hypothetical protein